MQPEVKAGTQLRKNKFEDVIKKAIVEMPPCLNKKGLRMSSARIKLTRATFDVRIAAMNTLAKSVRSEHFRKRLALEGDAVRRRFDGSDRCPQPGIEDLVRSDPEVWGMPIGLFLKSLGQRPSFLPASADRLLEFLRQYDCSNVDTRVAVDANIAGTIIVTIYVYDQPKHTIVWLTIGSIGSEM